MNRSPFFNRFSRITSSGVIDIDSGVISFAGRMNIVIPVAGDYSAPMITNPVAIFNTSPQNIDLTQFIVVANTANPSGMIFNLPTASGILGRMFKIKNENSGELTLMPHGVETIDGALNLPVTAPNSYDLVSDGVSNWIIV